ncbi:MAG: glycosyltransferase family 4 protein [Lachnospiraceae bacterium]|nr:glycosyltransferase family 4 protein [Lachnospiraceae bacterium]
MKILVVCQHYWPENFRINDLVDGFIERGHEVDVLCGQPNYPAGQFFEGYDSHSVKEEQHGNVKVYRTFEIKRGSNSNIRIFLNYITFPIASLFQIGKLKKKDYDRIFIYQLSPVMMGVAGQKLAKKKHIPCIMYVLDIWPQNLYSVINFKNKLIRKMLYKEAMWNYRQPDRLITVSDKMKQYFMEKLNRTEEQVTFIPQCPEKLYEQRMEDEELKGRFGSSFNIVYTGNISPAQDIDTIVAAAKKCADAGLNQVKFLIVGDGMSRTYFEEQVAKNGLENYFSFEGFHPMEDIPKYTGIADALLGTLKSEGLEDFSIPAKVMSYLAAGRPLLLAMEGEPKSIVKEADCGFASKPGDAEGLFENICKLYHMTKMDRDVLGEHAFLYQQEHFERDKNIEKMLEVICR